MVIGFSEDDYTGDEGEPGDASRPNTPCTVTVEIIQRSLEIPLQIQLTPREGNATSKKVGTYTVPIYYGKIGKLQTVMSALYRVLGTYAVNESPVCQQAHSIYQYVLNFTLVSVVTGGYYTDRKCRFCYICHRKL